MFFVRGFKKMIVSWKCNFFDELLSPVLTPVTV